MGVDDRTRVAEMFERAARELELSAQHFTTAARHMRDEETPRACAHAIAARGHLLNASEAADAAAREHSRHASP